MPGIGGVSIANNALANAVMLNLDRNQSGLKSSVARLSSGLRINTAADDPSGLAIAEKLHAQVDGFDQATRNVQDANNAATVAEGALQTTTDILQRVRTLAIEAASDITSPSDRANLQTEVQQLLLEVNRISQNTSFNGIALLDGSHAGSQPAQPAFVRIESNAVLATSGPGSVAAGVGTPAFSVLVPPVTNGDFSFPPLAPNSTTVPGASPQEGWLYQNFVGGNFSGIYSGSASLGWPTPPGGQQAAFIQSSPNATVSQTLTGFTPGATYQVQFSASGFNGNGFPTGLTLTFDGQDITPTNITSMSYPTFATFESKPFTVDASATHSLVFQNQQNPPAGFNFAWFTDVSVVPTTALLHTSTGILIACALPASAFFQQTAPGVAGINNGVGTVDGSIEIQVINTGASIAAQETFFNSATGETTVSPTLLGPDSVSDLFDNVEIVTGSFTTADVGLTSYLKVSQSVAAASNPNNPSLTIQSGATEGATIQIGIPATNTAALRVSAIDLTLSASGNASLAAEDAIGQIDLALDSLLNQRAQLGAVVVRLNEDAGNDQTASVNLQSSESAIRDLNVGQETTTFNRRQILVQVGTAVLGQANSNAQSVLRLFP